MNYYNNSAGRLYLLISEAQKIIKKDGNVNFRNGLSQILNIDNKDTTKLLRNIADIIDLIEKTKNEIEGIENINHQIYIQPLKALISAFQSIHLNSPMNQLNNYIKDDTILSLQFISDTLSNKNGANVIKEQDLNELLNDVEELNKEVIDSELPEKLKLIIIANLENIRNSILNYKIWGNEGLSKVLELNLGSIFYNGNLIKENREDKKVKLFFKVIQRLNDLVTFANNSKDIIGPVIKIFLTNGSQ